MPYRSTNIAVNQPAFLLISLLLPTILLGESAQAQPSPLIKGQSVFAPYQPEAKFAPAIRAQPQPIVAPSDRGSSANIEERPGQTSGQSPNLSPALSPNQAAEPANDQVQVPFTATPDGVPALNIVPTVERPPIPPPPDAAPLRPNGNGIARPAQAWRVKAFQLFKQKLDPTTIAIVLNANYNNVLLSLRQAVEEVGLTVSSISTSSGHMLITTNNEKAIVALRQALPDTKSDMRTEAKADAKPEAKTEVRVLCESRNKSLTTGRMKEILNKLQSKFGDMKSDAETL